MSDVYKSIEDLLKGDFIDYKDDNNVDENNDIVKKMQKSSTLDKDFLQELEQKAKTKFPQANYDAIRIAMAQNVAQAYGINIKDAQILVDGGLTREGLKKGNSYGVFESTPSKGANHGIENARALLKENKDAFGVLYGHGTSEKQPHSFIFKKPIIVKDQQEIKKIENALGQTSNKSGTIIKLKGVYK